MTTLTSHLPTLETVRDWLLDSFHQHFDDMIKLAVFIFLANGNDLAAVTCAAGAMLLFVALLVGTQHAVRAHEAKKETVYTTADAKWDSEVAALLAAK